MPLLINHVVILFFLLLSFLLNAAFGNMTPPPRKKSLSGFNIIFQLFVLQVFMRLFGIAT